MESKMANNSLLYLTYTLTDISVPVANARGRPSSTPGFPPRPPHISRATPTNSRLSRWSVHRSVHDRYRQ